MEEEKDKEPSRAEQKAALEAADLRECQQKIMAALAEHNCEIVCVPSFTEDGRITAQGHARNKRS